MSDRPWMPLNVGDYLKDTHHLTTLEHGAYLLLIMRYWEDSGLPDNEALIARYAGLTREQWAESRDVLAAFFDDGWTHKRIDAELARAAEVMEKRRASGKQGGTKRQANARQKPSETQHTDTDIDKGRSSSLRSDDRRTPRGELEIVLDADRARAVIESRQKMRKPLTVRGAELLAAQLAKWHDPNEAADAMVLNGWQGFKPEYLENRARGSPQKPMRGSEFFYAASEVLGDGTGTLSDSNEGDWVDAPRLSQRAIGHNG